MKEFRHPNNQRELEEREAAGFWKAIGYVNKLSREKNCAIDLSVLREIHRTIFLEVVPDIAGRYRGMGEDTMKLRFIIPPPGSQVAARMMEFQKELEERIAGLPPRPKTKSKKKSKKTYRRWIYKVVELAAWAQHKIAAIHPFSNGNGRTARLFTNLVLQSHGLTGSRIKFEQSDKEAYLKALEQADKTGDLKPLVDMVFRAMMDQYQTIIKQRKDYSRGHT